MTQNLKEYEQPLFILTSFSVNFFIVRRAIAVLGPFSSDSPRFWHFLRVFLTFLVVLTRFDRDFARERHFKQLFGRFVITFSGNACPNTFSLVSPYTTAVPDSIPQTDDVKSTLNMQITSLVYSFSRFFL